MPSPIMSELQKRNAPYTKIEPLDKPAVHHSIDPLAEELYFPASCLRIEEYSMSGFACACLSKVKGDKERRPPS
ncbi:hypothetical protein FBZ96_1011012 [Bradyrhizobium stylosanthis]|uniref:Uncharacterized protein n=1 Tax=Bradyrhizobium stylosanthis TaxID=1803665 RepID=A0A560ECY7_9BRAD|nr:hypothetical protein FBZ96_1011012 [Bradyrhizobium stylosanthis]